jgi:hypothetical protein
MDKGKYQYEGLKWMFELELLSHPQVINQIRFNILVMSKQIKEVELLIYRENKSMLVLLELGWIGRTFQKRRIFTEVQEMLMQLLPSFRFRVTDDPVIMELAVARVKKALTGGQNENVSNPSIAVDKQSTEQSSAPAPVAGEQESGSGESTEASTEKPSETVEEIRIDAVADDSKKE